LQQTVLRSLFDLVNSRLDRSIAGRRWQVVKWKLKYRLKERGHLPDFPTLIAQPHRPFLRDAVLALGDISSVLEIGCGKGPNLYLLWQKKPAIDLVGTDPSRSAIAHARRQLRDRGLERIQLELGSADDLSAFATASMDVVMADAVLKYIPPANAAHVLSEMLRVARRAIVLSTWHFDAHDGDATRYDEGTWVYDYRRLMADHARIAVDITPYAAGVWQDTRWKRYGSIVTARHICK
jgi:ubiquinone/menaquinone biosynthesis C-methylase UbiE